MYRTETYCRGVNIKPKTELAVMLKQGRCQQGDIFNGQDDAECFYDATSAVVL